MGQALCNHLFTKRLQLLAMATLAAGWLLAAALGSAAQAAIFTVNSTLDAVDAHPGDGVCATVTNVCTLRAAIQETNALAGADTIDLPAGIFILSIAGAGEDAATGDLDITDDLTLTGAGAASTIIDGNRLDRVFDIFRVGVVNAPIVTLSAVTIQNGRADSGADGSGGNGGGIANSGTLTLTNSTLSHNTAGSGGGDFNGGPGGSGGGIANSGRLTLTNSTLSDNTAGSGGGVGCCIGFNGGDGGSGGGIFNSGRLALTNSTLSHNSGGDGGGGFDGHGGSGGPGGGIFNSGVLTVTDSTLSDNTAGSGGFSSCCEGGSGGPGGGIFNSGVLTVTDSTLSDNTTGSGAFESNGPGFGGGIFNSPFPVVRTVILRNTIVANNDFGGDCFGPMTDGGYNLAGDTTCALSAPTSLSNTDPLLLPLRNNGGPTDTQALCTGLGTPVAACTGKSPAIDAIPEGLNGCGTAITTDQRGVPRPQGAGCDIGAFEATDVLVPFTAFTAHLLLWHSPPSIAHFVAQGAFTLGKASKGITPLTEPVVFSLADTAGSLFTQTLPPGSFKPFGTGSFLFRAPQGSPGIQSLLIQATAGARRRFTFLVLGEQRGRSRAEHPPVTVSLQIGDDVGAEKLPCRKVLQGLLCQ